MNAGTVAVVAAVAAAATVAILLLLFVIVTVVAYRFCCYGKHCWQRLVVFNSQNKHFIL